MEKLVQALLEKKYTLASIESLTAGLFAAQMAEVSGASAVLKGALVTYQTCIKEDVLHVDKALIAKYRVISKECAIAMATQGKKMFGSDIVVSFSGNAGPQVMDDKPVGLVHMAMLIQDTLWHFEETFQGERNAIRQQACAFMEKQLLTHL